MGQKVIKNLNGVKHEAPEFFGGSDLAVLKSSFFVEGDNQFDCYHFEINMVIDYLWEHVNKEFSLDNLSRIANLSPYYLVRLFKDNTGKTPYAYYMDIKISKAKEYLKAGKHSITEVCFILGFSSHSHFSLIFS